MRTQTPGNQKHRPHAMTLYEAGGVSYHSSRRNAVEEARRAVAEHGVGPNQTGCLLRPQVLDPRLPCACTTTRQSSMRSARGRGFMRNVVAAGFEARQADLHRLGGVLHIMSQRSRLGRVGVSSLQVWRGHQFSMQARTHISDAAEQRHIPALQDRTRPGQVHHRLPAGIQTSHEPSPHNAQGASLVAPSQHCVR